MRIFFFGNCQVQALHDVYRSLVVPLTGDSVAWQHSFVALTAENAAAIAAADVLVTQVAHFEPKTDITHINTPARRLSVPVVGTPFIWPYSGVGHPDALRKYGKYNPYPSERSDSWLLRRLAQGAAPEAAVAEYLDLDIAKAAHLDRRMEMELDNLRAREIGTPYQASSLIDSHFRTEQLFRTPYHPTLRMARYMALTFLRDLGVPDAAYARVEARMLDDLYLKYELPVHPGIAAHFGLEWAPPTRRYRFYNESYLTFTEFMHRFVQCRAYPEVPAAIRAVDTGAPDRRAKLEHALTLVPDSPWAHHAMGTLLVEEGRPDAALGWLLRAKAAYPAMLGLHVHLAECLEALGRPREAIAALQAELALQPFNLRIHNELVEAQLRLDDITGAVESLARAIEIEPERADLVRRRAMLLKRAPASRAAVPAPPAAAPALVTSRTPEWRPRKIFFFGNCQIKALHDALAAFVTPITGDTLAWSHSFNPLSAAHAGFIAAADVLVTQAAHFAPKTDISHITTKARRMVVPVVGTPFIWPFSGQGHPESRRRYPKYDPFGGEQGDAWLLRRLQKGATPDDAIRAYLAEDIARTAHVERRMEMELDLLRAREAGTSFAAADIIAESFRREKLFRTPYHLTPRMARYMVLTFLADLGVPDAVAERVEQRMLDDFYIKSEVPVHPSIAAHFGLDWVDESTRYRFFVEDVLPRDDLYRRLLRCEAYPEVSAALQAVTRNEPGCGTKLEQALSLVPESPWLHQAKATLLLREGHAVAALAHAARAQARYPALHGIDGQIAECLWQLGRQDEAVAALRTEIARNPYTLRLYVALAHWLVKLEDWTGAAESVAKAVQIEPAREDLAAWWERLSQRAQQGAVTAS